MNATRARHGSSLRRIAPRARLAAVALVAFVASAAQAGAAETYSLGPRHQPGQRWSMKLDLRVDLRETTMLGRTTPATGWITLDEAVDVTIAEADADGRFKAIDLNFGNCEKRNLEPLMDRPNKTRPPYTDRDVRVERATNKTSGKEALAVTSQGRDADGETEDYALGLFASTLMPPAPVPVGERWTVESVEYMFGRGYKGRANCRLLRVEQRGGRAVAQVGVEGRATWFSRQGITVVHNFTGTMEVDVAERLPTLVSLTGKTDIEHRTGEGAVMLMQRGDLTYTRKQTIQQTLVQDPPPAPAPAPDPVRPNNPLGRRPADTSDPLAQPPPATRPAGEPNAAGDTITYVHPEGRYTVVVPKRWRAAPAAGGAAMTFADDAAGASLAVEVTGPVTATSAEEYFRQAEAPLLKQGGAEVVEAAARDVGGVNGFAGALEMKAAGDGLGAAGGPRRGFVQVALAGGRAIVFRVTVPAAAFDQAAPELKRVRQSFQIHDPPKPPAKKGGLSDW